MPRYQGPLASGRLYTVLREMLGAASRPTPEQLYAAAGTHVDYGRAIRAALTARANASRFEDRRRGREVQPRATYTAMAWERAQADGAFAQLVLAGRKIKVRAALRSLGWRIQSGVVVPDDRVQAVGGVT